MIIARRLCKSFGTVQALAEVSFHVERGAVYGLIGPNGAGKSTCLGILATLLLPDEGSVTIAGRLASHHVRETRRSIGYVPDFFGLTAGVTVYEYLDFYGGCCGLARAARRRRIGEVLELVDLTDRRDAAVEILARGAKQRLCLAKALLHEPEVLILDEPAADLDPQARSAMMKVLRWIVQQQAMTIVIASSVLADLDVLCTHMGILHQGRLQRDGTLAEILGAARPRTIWTLGLSGDVGRVVGMISRLDYLGDIALEEGGVRFSLDALRLRQQGLPAEALPRAVLEAIAASGAGLLSAEAATPDLDEVFQGLFGEVRT